MRRSIVQTGVSVFAGLFVLSFYAIFVWELVRCHRGH